MKKEKLVIFAILFCSIWSAACSPANNFIGETYAGKTTINDAEPNEASIEKFQLSEVKSSEGKIQKVIILAAENKIIGNCTIPLEDKSSADSRPKRHIGKWFIPYQSGVTCSSAIGGGVAKFVVHSGSVTPNVDESKNDVRFEMLAVNTVDSKSYHFEVNAERK